MKQAFILLISIAVVFVVPGAQGTAHLSFSNTTANVTRTDCGTTLLCVETPEDCDPASNDTCLFASVNGTAGVAPNGATLSFQLSGTTSNDSYIALLLTANESEGTSMVFICARTNTSMNPTFFFRTMERNNTNGMLTPTETIVTEIQNSLTTTRIQCAFNVPGLNATATRKADTTFVVLLGSGSVNETTIGDLAINLTTAALNLIDPTSNLNIITTPATTPTPTPTTNNNTTPTTDNNTTPTTGNNTTPTTGNNTTGNNTTPTTGNNTTPTTGNNTTPTTGNNTTPTTGNNTTPTTGNNTTPTTTPALVTRTGCGNTKLCVETPEDCDPATDNTCLFTSVSASTPSPSNGTTLSFEVSGTISGNGYVGVALAPDASQGTSTLYVCGRNGTTNGVNGTFFFVTVQINNTNGALTVMTGTATGIRNLTTDTRIQCVFDIPRVGAPTPRTVDTTSVLQLGSGSVNGSNLGSFTANVTTPPLDLTNPAANVNTTTSPALVTRTGCGTTKLCVETPEDCDPATDNTCLFTSVNGTAGVAPNGATLSFELSGTSSGDAYVGVALTANASEGTGMLYVCGRNGTTNGVNGTFFFLTVQINNTNGALTVMNGTATGIQNLTSDTRIQCVFDISGVNATATRKRDTTFVLQLGSGRVNGSTLGTFNANVTTPALNLLDPTSNLNNTATTVAPTTMSGANRVLIPQALPLLLSIFILSILKTA